MEKQQIKITIGERTYPLAIDPSIEETIRQAVRNLNQEMEKLLRTYEIDAVDALSMILLREECSLIEARKANEGDYGDLLSDLKSIDSKLEEYLRSR